MTPADPVDLQGGPVPPSPADPVDRLDPVVLHHVVNTLGWPDLRPLQRAAIQPVMDGEDAVLLAPTAGGKTEAACLPILSAMSEGRWSGTSVLYLCPLKALLNNLVTRVDSYAQWLGRRAELWHGDTKESQRRRIRLQGPDILLTTPESLEAMLIGVKTDHARLLGGVRAVVVDEVHAFAGDDRGWHLLAVLERLEQVTGRSIQRIGLSATVGNPRQLLTWLQGARARERPGQVVAPELAPASGTGPVPDADLVPASGTGPVPDADLVPASGTGPVPDDLAPAPDAGPLPDAGAVPHATDSVPDSTSGTAPGTAPGPGPDTPALLPDTPAPLLPDTPAPLLPDTPAPLPDTPAPLPDTPALLPGAAPVPAPPPGDVELDYVGSLGNAARLIAALHRGEKRLVFCESRRQVEELGAALRAREVTVFLSHASLSADERARSEQAFTEARDCVIVSTSTLELGIDVGDLDRVVQIDSPRTVASFLQRIGRTGRRPGSTRNCLILATDQETLLQAAALLVLWGRGWVEPVTPPPEPRHLVAQQLLAATLQQHRIGDRLWPGLWNGLAPFDRSAAPILRHLTGEGFLDEDGGMLFIGPEAERRFGRRHFIELTASFTAPPQFTVLSGRKEIGQTDPSVLTEERPGPRRLLLAGRSWQVTFIDWGRRRVFVEPADGGGLAKWTGSSLAGLSHTLTRAMREVLLGADPPVSLTRRARACLTEWREDEAPGTAHPGGTLVTRVGGDVRWWTWAGYRANATLAATLPSIADPVQRPADCHLRLREDLTPELWRTALAAAGEGGALVLPDIDPRAVRGLKFSAALPERLAVATLAARLADFEGATVALREPVRFHTGP
ncbi:DEAD/DEAH box helicase [Streptomyces sp. NPDC051018]|uniref:DEAD/DEAH box helicase n=1 Tax=Streptomyces sp. NPDC051018 TaxID=3365639 RepID=UPI0037AAFCC8